MTRDLTPGEYDSDDLDRLVAEADRKASRLRYVECPECGSFSQSSGPGPLSAWEATYAHEDGCSYETFSQSDGGEDNDTQ